jgi:hypothetical protein
MAEDEHGHRWIRPEELPDLEGATITGSIPASELPIASGSIFIPTPEKSPSTVFVAYPYAFSKEDYRNSFSEVGDEFGVTFLYADEEITNKQILDKIKGMIEGATFSIFDITSWNANVALELGIAVGLNEDYYILFNPEHDQTDVPSDLGGIDRLQYSDFTSLKSELSRLMEQQFGAPEDEEQESGSTGDSFNQQIEQLRAAVPDIVSTRPGIQIGGIASQLGIPVDFAQSITRPLLGDNIESQGERRGTRYFLKGEAPMEEAESGGDQDA